MSDQRPFTETIPHRVLAKLTRCGSVMTLAPEMSMQVVYSSRKALGYAT
jgi:hypothetical protein